MRIPCDMTNHIAIIKFLFIRCPSITANALQQVDDAKLYNVVEGYLSIHQTNMVVLFVNLLLSYNQVH